MSHITDIREEIKRKEKYLSYYFENPCPTNSTQDREVTRLEKEISFLKWEHDQLVKDKDSNKNKFILGTGISLVSIVATAIISLLI